MENLVGLLNRDIEGEHRAIVQYLYHAWQAPDEAIRGKLEGLARDEMRHLEWLSEQVVELGGRPDLRRGPVVRQGAWRDLLAADLADERAAIAAYRERIRTAEGAGRRELALVLERILADEEGHREFLERALAGLAAESGGAQAGQAPVTGAERQGVTEGRAAAEAEREALAWGIRHEYEVIMDYVYHALAGGHPEVRHELLDLAVDEMKHLGWLAERLAEIGGQPELEGVAPPEALPIRQMLERALATEKTVTQKYDEQARRTADDEAKKLLHRIRLDELWHDHVFREMLQRLSPGERARHFTVGSLKKGV